MSDQRFRGLARLRAAFAAVDWRREAVYPLTAIMEVAWFTPWYMALIPATARLSPGRTAAGLFLVMVIPVYTARALARLRLKPQIQRAVLAVLLLSTCLLALRVFLYAGQTYQGFAWLAETIQDVLDVYEIIPDWLVIVVSTLFLWWRGIRLGQRPLSVAAVAFSFYVGIVALIGFVLLVNLVTDQDPTAFIPVFFLSSLMALAVTRMEQMRGLRGAIRSPFSLWWLAAISAAALGVVLLATLLGGFVTRSGMQTVLRWIAPLLLPLGILLGVLVAVLREAAGLVLGLFRALGLDDTARPLADLISGLGRLIPDELSAGRIEGPQGMLEAPAAVSQVVGMLRLAALLGIVVVMGVLVVWMVRGQGLRRRGDDGEEHDALLSSTLLLENVRAFLSAGQGRLAALAGVLGRAGLRGLFAALTIRRIYAQMAHLAAEQGYPRAAFQTPYEYERTAVRAFPRAASEVRAITAAYVAVHYGELPETDADLQAIRGCWQRLRASLSTENAARP